MQLIYSDTVTDERFDDRQTITDSGLIPLARLCQMVDLPGLVEDQLRMTGPGSAHTGHKIMATVLGMCAGADSVSDLDRLRTGAMDRVFSQIRASSTIGTFHRALTEHNIGDYAHIATEFTTALASRTPVLNRPRRRGRPARPGDDLVMLDLDDTMIESFSTRKQGAAYGYTRFTGLSAASAIASMAGNRPIILTHQLRSGRLGGSPCTGVFTADALTALARIPAIADRRICVRGDTAMYTRDIVHAALAAGAYVSVGIKKFPNVIAAIDGLDESVWVPIDYPGAIHDCAGTVLTSPGQVAEVPFTAFSSSRHKKTDRVKGRLIIRRVLSEDAIKKAEQNPDQDGLFPPWEYHAFFTTLPADEYPTVDADRIHRGHAIIEQVNAELKNGPLAHLPFHRLAANSAWLAAAVMAHNLLTTAGSLTDTLQYARTGSLRSKLVNVPARITRSGRRLILHLPENWPWASDRRSLTRALAPPTAA